MGDMADYDMEQGMDLWFDHLAGHPSFPDRCPYCEDDEKKREFNRRENDPYCLKMDWRNIS